MSFHPNLRLQPHHLRLAPGCIPHQPLHGLFPCPLNSRSCNHQHAGASLSAPDLPDDVSKGKFMITTARKQVRRGMKEGRTVKGHTVCTLRLRYNSSENTCWPVLGLLDTLRHPPTGQFFFQIGSGRKAYDAAIKAVKAWEHLQLGEMRRFGVGCLGEGRMGQESTACVRTGRGWQGEGSNWGEKEAWGTGRGTSGVSLHGEGGSRRMIPAQHTAAHSQRGGRRGVESHALGGACVGG